MIIRAALGAPRLDPHLGFHTASPSIMTGAGVGPSPSESDTARMGLRLFLLQYVANIGPPFEEADRPVDEPLPTERRKNPHGRMLWGWAKDQMEERGFGARTEQEFLTDLREALRQEGSSNPAENADAAGHESHTPR